MKDEAANAHTNGTADNETAAFGAGLLKKISFNHYIMLKEARERERKEW